jgi:CheY-like chemotaxis protein
MTEQKEFLIIDDSEESRVFLSTILEANGYAYRVASGGREAMEALSEKRPDLVLLDIMMPDRNGLLLFKDMKKDPALKDIPVIFITGVSDETGVDIMTGEKKPLESYADQFTRSVGARVSKKFGTLNPDGMIEKPVDPEHLVGMIKGILR